ncbi:DUF1877 family protein [Actinomadura sp. LCR2-06]|uniref:DUF1877 family protein n=1 Tax=Actinomadura violacea TaxID=2819934 RepID=A0ABS3RNL7_9ACTN|nr:DUF1877 family protein [Actinomadura violacea]
MDRVLADPEWGRTFAEELRDAEGIDRYTSMSQSTDRCFDTAMWDALQILIGRALPKLDTCPILGGTPFGERWRYDKPRFLTLEQVCALAEQLAALPFDRLVDAYDARALAEACNGPWGRDNLFCLKDTYGAFSLSYFPGAAASGQAMVLYRAENSRPQNPQPM